MFAAAEMNLLWTIDAQSRTAGGQSKGVPSAVKIVLDTFRHSYVLRYHATGVTRAGWHDVAVRLPTHDGVEIRARKGYFGG